MEALDVVEAFLKDQDQEADRAETRRALMERLKQANEVAAGLQEKVARASLFLPSYDLRLGNETVCKLHEMITTSRHALSPPATFSFKSRRCPPAPLSALLHSIHGDTGSTSRQDHFQGDTRAGDIDAELCFIDREDQVLVKRAGEVGGRDFVLSRLRRCTIYICDTCGALRADRLEGCKVYVGPVRSVLAEKLERCEISVAAQQLRIHSAEACDFYVHTRSGPIIEHSKQLRFGRYNFQYAGCEKHLQGFGLDQDSDMWSRVEDFNWLRTQQSPNWKIIPPLEEENLVSGDLAPSRS
ncbi:hypothetical protein GUITHDRAFT_150387 [Guillardia theta CCMP2712]|uniref:C-CAP/cofactor C-like domain-containing protein n=1 Tax=Guillardia theta (strain CCMP2712) TaxID=905079 RepID=L1JYE6_GUITC|nr:hypothetical protein GUITHDRAFT_150387 [Guillardia theta CCMP2712]EKX53344.1 hypothetical protein GUITHDRAFT_150387 [Guillardia theta CCMP2712]|eukprot:XP_005840324.1 hypothetical protein GUITHDRAFT_150387 [Guillardia theta CCMP2712]